MLLGPLLWNLELEISKAANDFLVKIMLRLMIREGLKKEKNGILLRGGGWSLLIHKP